MSKDNIHSNMSYVLCLMSYVFFIYIRPRADIVGFFG